MAEFDAQRFMTEGNDNLVIFMKDPNDLEARGEQWTSIRDAFLRARSRVFEEVYDKVQEPVTGFDYKPREVLEDGVVFNFSWPKHKEPETAQRIRAIVKEEMSVPDVRDFLKIVSRDSIVVKHNGDPNLEKELFDVVGKAVEAAQLERLDNTVEPLRVGALGLMFENGDEPNTTKISVYEYSEENVRQALLHSIRDNVRERELGEIIEDGPGKIYAGQSLT